MTSAEFKSPWEGVWSLDVIVNRRLRRPRTTGITMVIDSGSVFPPYGTSWRWRATISTIGNSASAPRH